MDIKRNSKTTQPSTVTKRDSKLTDSPIDPTMPISTPVVARNERWRGVSVNKDIDPHDGKTTSCDRDHTFDMFLSQDKMPEKDKAKRMGHTWEVVRAVKRLRKLKKPLRKLARRRRDRRVGDDGIECENLISVKR